MSAPAPRFCSSCGTALVAGARFCAHCGAPIAGGTAPPAASAASADGERRQACVLFADLCGFTDLSQRLDAEEVRNLLARYFAAVDAEIRRHGGTIDKHVGDAVMGVFGAPVSHGNDAERAVRAALAMHAAVAALGEVGGSRIAIHVGIASGEVVAGRTGSDLHSEYTVTGPAANLASRLVDRAEPGETVISDGVLDAARRVGGVDTLGEMSLKGIAAPVRVWRVAAAAARLTAPGAPLIGRAAELAQLAALIDATAAGKGQVIVLRGDPGIGKTRLVEEVLVLAAAAGLRCVRAGALDFGLARSDDPGGVIARGLIAHAPDEAAGHAVALDDLLARDRSPASAVAWDAMTLAAREAARCAAMSALAAAAAIAPGLLIAVEDLHWADATTLGWIATIAAAARGRPIALLLTTRIDGDPIDRAWRATVGATPLTTVDLAPLDPEDSLRLTRAMLPDAGAAPRAWVARAGGNPLFLIELARHAAELESAVPDNVQSVVQARVDRLAVEDKALIQCASAAGQRVDPALLAYLATAAGSTSVPSPSRLLAAGLLRQDGETLVFGHALIRDGVYATLLRTRRRDLHRRAAAFFAGRDTALEARHLDSAEDPGAADAYRRAATAAFGRGQIVEALALVERGLERAPAPGVRAALKLARGDALIELGRVPEAEATFRDVAVAESVADRCEAWLGVAASLRIQSRVDDALAALDEVDRARGGDPSLALTAARCHHLRGNLYFARGDATRCRAEHEAALDLARAAGSVELEVRALNGLGDAAYAAGRMRAALDAFEGSSALCRANGFGRIDQSNRFMIGICLVYQLEFDRARAVLDEAIAAADRAGSRFMQMITRESLGIVLNCCGAYGESLAILEHALAVSRELGSRRFDAIILSIMAHDLHELGRCDEARPIAREAVATAMDVGPGFIGASALGALAVATDDDAERRRALADGEALLTGGCIGHNYFWFYRDAMEVCLRTGRSDEALRYAGALEAYTAQEPLPWSDLHIRRTRALAATPSGPGGPATSPA